MILDELTPEQHYFRIPGGNTVLEARPTGWIRWDRWDGPVATSLWSAQSPGLVALTAAEARELIGAER